MRISLGCDHAGFELKEKVRKVLLECECCLVDEGTFGPEAVDYPEVAVRVAAAVASGRVERGVLICGTGIGMAMAANKLPGVRAAVCHSLETARLSRLHNDANILALGGRILNHGLALEIVREWLQTGFEGGRHNRRLKLIAQLERQGE